MSVESDPPPIEIVADSPDPHIRGVVITLAQMAAPLAAFGWFLGGPREAVVYALPLLIPMALFVVVPWFLRRKGKSVRATLTQDGVAVDDFHFRWSEIKSVSRVGPLRGVWLSSLTIHLNRPRKFWTFSARPTDRVKLPASLWRQTPLLNELKSRIPESGQSALEEAPAVPWQYGLIPLACSLAAAALGILLAADATGWFVLAIAISAVLTTYLTGSLAGFIWVEDESIAADLLTSAFYPLLFWAMVVFFVFLESGRFPLLVGTLIGIAAACSLPEIMLFAGCRKVRGYHAGSFYALVAAGFLAGWFGYGGIPDVEVAEGRIGYRNPWTPAGDGFLISLDNSGYPPVAGRKDTSLRWYSAALKPERDVQVPDLVDVIVVGQDSALCRTAYGSKREGQEIWLISRHEGEVKRLLTGGWCQVTSASPGRNYAIVDSGEEKETRPRNLVSMNDGLTRPFALPAGFDASHESFLLLPRDDGAVLLIKGSVPLDKGNRRVFAHTELPETGDFPHPGELFGIWLWYPFGSAAPVQIYAAKAQWLEYRRHSLYARNIYVCRVAAPPHKEYIAIDLTKTPLADSPADEEAFLGDMHDPSDSGSSFSVSQRKMLMPERLLVTDKRTGRTRYLRNVAGVMFSSPFGFFSPKGDKMLVETRHFHDYFFPGAPRAEAAIRTTVHFVDLAAAFR